MQQGKMTSLNDFLFLSQREDSTSMPGLSRYSTPSMQSMSNFTYASEHVDHSEVEPSPRVKFNNFIVKAREGYPLLAEADDTIIDDNDAEEEDDDDGEEIVFAQPKRSSTTTDFLRSEIRISNIFVDLLDKDNSTRMMEPSVLIHDNARPNLQKEYKICSNKLDCHKTRGKQPLRRTKSLNSNTSQRRSSARSRRRSHHGTNVGDQNNNNNKDCRKLCRWDSSPNIGSLTSNSELPSSRAEATRGVRRWRSTSDVRSPSLPKRRPEQQPRQVQFSDDDNAANGGGGTHNNNDDKTPIQPQRLRFDSKSNKNNKHVDCRLENKIVCNNNDKRTSAVPNCLPRRKLSDCF